MVAVKETYIYTRYMHVVPRVDNSKKCEDKIAHICLNIGTYLFQEVEVDLQNCVQDSDLKQQPLQILTKRQAAEQAT